MKDNTIKVFILGSCVSRDPFELDEKFKLWKQDLKKLVDFLTIHKLIDKGLCPEKVLIKEKF